MRRSWAKGIRGRQEWEGEGPEQKGEGEGPEQKGEGEGEGGGEGRKERERVGRRTKPGVRGNAARSGLEFIGTFRVYCYHEALAVEIGRGQARRRSWSAFASSISRSVTSASHARPQRAWKRRPWPIRRHGCPPRRTCGGSSRFIAPHRDVEPRAQGLRWAAVGQELGISADAARMLVSRVKPTDQLLGAG